MKHFLFSSILLLFATFAVAQNTTTETLKGKVTADFSELDGIYVINNKTEKSTTTNVRGYFTIQAAVGDTLMFSSVAIIGKRFAVTKEDLESELVFHKMEMQVNRIAEVMVNPRSQITAQSLGLVPKNQIKFTPAERKLNAASNPYATIGLASSVSFDPVLNWISGRTAMLKKEVEVEKKEGWLEVLANLYTKEYIEKLKIPAEYVDGFFRYCVEDSRFVATLKAQNKTLAAFQLTELALRYNEIITLESK